MRGLALLALISRPPAAGKSTLAQAFSERVGLPVLSTNLINVGVAFSIGGHLGPARPGMTPHLLLDDNTAPSPRTGCREVPRRLGTPT